MTNACIMKEWHEVAPWASLDGARGCGGAQAHGEHFCVPVTVAHWHMEVLKKWLQNSDELRQHFV